MQWSSAKYKFEGAIRRGYYSVSCSIMAGEESEITSVDKSVRLSKNQLDLGCLASVGKSKVLPTPAVACLNCADNTRLTVVKILYLNRELPYTPTSDNSRLIVVEILYFKRRVAPYNHLR